MQGAADKPRRRCTNREAKRLEGRNEVEEKAKKPLKVDRINIGTGKRVGGMWGGGWGVKKAGK